MNQETKTLDFEITEADLETAFNRTTPNRINICKNCVASVAAQRQFGNENITSAGGQLNFRDPNTNDIVEKWYGGEELHNYMHTFDMNCVRGLDALKWLLKPQKFVLTLQESAE